MTKFYRIKYGEKLPDRLGYEYTFEEIPDYVPPTNEELLRYVEQLYMVAVSHLRQPETLPISAELTSFFNRIHQEINSSNITSDAIRHHQNPRDHKFPEDEMIRARKRKQFYDSGGYNGLI